MSDVSNGSTRTHGFHVWFTSWRGRHSPPTSCVTGGVLGSCPQRVVFICFYVRILLMILNINLVYPMMITCHPKFLYFLITHIHIPKNIMVGSYIVFTMTVCGPVWTEPWQWIYSIHKHSIMCLQLIRSMLYECDLYNINIKVFILLTCNRFFIYKMKFSEMYIWLISLKYR